MVVVSRCTPPLVILLLLLGISSAPAQGYTIDWSTIDAGGGASTGSGYSLSGTIGQPDANPALTGGGYSLTGGFWSLFAQETTGAPLLTIFLTTTNTVVVSWASPSTGFNLQQTTNLSSGIWTAPSETITDGGTVKIIIVNPPAGNRFYRLFKP
jgi:hypothetical protein